MLKLVPPDYKLSILPLFFNHTDGERIGMLIMDECSSFLIANVPKKVMFSVAVKIFAYNNNVNSVRICIVKYVLNASGQQEENQPEQKVDMDHLNASETTAGGETTKRVEDKVKPDPQDAPPKSKD